MGLRGPEREIIVQPVERPLQAPDPAERPEPERRPVPVGPPEEEDD